MYIEELMPDTMTIVYCDICGKPREVTLKHSRKIKRWGHCLCRSCSQIGLIKTRKPVMVTNVEELGILAPCGEYLMETLKGRCKKYLTCDDYGTCTQIAGLRHWGGFCVKKRDE